MSMDYIRKTYGLKVKVGDRVTYTGGTKPARGTVVGAKGAHLRIRMESGRVGIFHPGWELSALRATDSAQTGEADK